MSIIFQDKWRKAILCVQCRMRWNFSFVWHFIFRTFLPLSKTKASICFVFVSLRKYFGSHTAEWTQESSSTSRSEDSPQVLLQHDNNDNKKKIHFLFTVSMLLQSQRCSLKIVSPVILLSWQATTLAAARPVCSRNRRPQAEHFRETWAVCKGSCYLTSPLLGRTFLLNSPT